METDDSWWVSFFVIFCEFFFFFSIFFQLLAGEFFKGAGAGLVGVAKPL